ncbi:MAG: lytic transglycosylase domain-containing protein [Odoribacter sp.]|nr:lytic transglycosylase domain-containing protein [Odoribacter sp.]
MKNLQTLIYICITFAVINLLTLLLVVRHDSDSLPEPVGEGKNEVAASLVGCDVYLPQKLTLAGETVPLHRWDVQEALRKELIVNTYLHSHTLQILKTAPRVFAVIEPILKENGIPDDFKYLAVIESRLDPLAVSPVGAVGTWQLMKGTAQELGLEVNSEVDERYHLEKATRAAAAYLKKAYEKFGSWTLAAAAYNAGQGLITKQRNIQQQENYYDLLLGEETERYVFRILALKQIMTHPEKYNFQLPVPYPQNQFERVEVKGKVKDWAAFAADYEISYKTLKRFNPWLRKNVLNNHRRKTYEVLIPLEKDKYK